LARRGQGRGETTIKNNEDATKDKKRRKRECQPSPTGGKIPQTTSSIITVRETGKMKLLTRGKKKKGPGFTLEGKDVSKDAGGRRTLRRSVKAKVGSVVNEARKGKREHTRSTRG